MARGCVGYASFISKEKTSCKVTVISGTAQKVNFWPMAFARCVALDKSLSLSEPPFLHLQKCQEYPH